MIRTLRTNFTGGVLSREARDRLDLAVWKNGVESMENLRIKPVGGAVRRPGFAFVDNNPAHHWHVGNSYQLEPFVFADGQEYVFSIGAGWIGIYDRIGRNRIAELGAPWPDALVYNNELSIVQAYDTMLIFHKDYEQRRITRNSSGGWEIGTITWSTFDDGRQNCQRPPMHKYAQSHVAMWPDGPTNSPTVGYMNMTTSDPVFQAGHYGTWFTFKGHYLFCVGVISPTVASMVLVSAGIEEWETHSINWQEQAFSPVRGWPRSACLHQQRLYLGGGRDAPNTIWGSTTYDPFNFYTGTAQPTDAIKYAAAADRVAQIKRMVSYGHLQIFTSDGEFFAPTPDSGTLTPTTFGVQQQSGFGIANSPAVRFDRATIFISRAASAIREFAWDGQNTSYSSDTLTFLAKDLIRYPRDLNAAMETTEAQEALGFVTNGDGTLAVLSKVRKENVAAWMLWRTANDLNHGYPGYIVALGVNLRSGNLLFGKVRVGSEGQITTPIAVSELEAGFEFSCFVRPIVDEVQKPDGLSWGEPKRIVSTTLSLVDTVGGYIDRQRLPFDNAEQDPGLSPDPFTGKFQSWRLGWGLGEAPLIGQDRALPFELNAIGMEVEV